LYEGNANEQAMDEVKEFLAASGLPVVTSPMGKGAINEQSANYCGIYAGSITRPDLKERVESADLVLTIGSVKSDFNTAGFTYRVSQLATIDLHSTMVQVKYSEYPNVQMHGVLRQLAARIRAEKLPHVTPGPKPHTQVPEKGASPTITHEWMWPQLGGWLRPDDVVVTETGTSNFGILDARFPAGVRAVNQYLWGSIGYATPAAQGVALAVRDNLGGTCAHGSQHGQHHHDARHGHHHRGHGGQGRTVLWTGDGSLQLTAQSISTMLRNGLAPVVFVICNGGYTIERFIHGMDAAYNDVADWKYGELPATFGSAEGKSKSYVVKTKEEFEKLLASPEFSDPESQVLRLVEVYMERDDAPFAMKVTSSAAAKGVDG
jgi:pyruvate decarboxylase